MIFKHNKIPLMLFLTFQFGSGAIQAPRTMGTSDNSTVTENMQLLSGRSMFPTVEPSGSTLPMINEPNMQGTSNSTYTQTLISVWYCTLLCIRGKLITAFNGLQALCKFCSKDSLPGERRYFLQPIKSDTDFTSMITSRVF